MPIWSEEQGWLHHARLIAHLERVHPIVAKSDFPSSFQVYPIAFLGWLDISPITASRITAVFYYSIGLFMFFLCLLKIENETESTGVRFGLMFALGSPMLVYYVLTGWHEIAPVFLLTAFAFLCFLYAYFLRDEGAVVLFGAAVGICFWTLYTPALWALILGAVFLAATWKRRAFGMAASFILAFLVVAAPCLGVICRNPEFILHRHINFYLHAGEEPHVLQDTGDSRVERFFIDFRRTVDHVLPRSERLTFDMHGFVNPPWTTALTALFGFFVVCAFWRFLIVPIVVPSVLLFLGIVASSPTYWRESILEFPILVFAAIGVGYIFSMKSTERSKIAVFGLVMIIISLQVVIFTKRLEHMSEVFLERKRNGIPFACMVECIERENLGGDVIGLPHDFPFNTLQALTFEDLELELFRTADLLEGEVGAATVFFMRRSTLELLRQQAPGDLEFYERRLECSSQQDWVRGEIRFNP
jgi:hypothetical protein